VVQSLLGQSDYGAPEDEDRHQSLNCWVKKNTGQFIMSEL
jgi:hypothetical protein